MEKTYFELYRAEMQIMTQKHAESVCMTEKEIADLCFAGDFYGDHIGRFETREEADAALDNLRSEVSTREWGSGNLLVDIAWWEEMVYDVDSEDEECTVFDNYIRSEGGNCAVKGWHGKFSD